MREVAFSVNQNETDIEPKISELTRKVSEVLTHKNMEFIAGCGDKELQGLINGTLRLVERIESEKPDSLVFVDSSARPMAYLLKEFYRHKGLDDQLPAIVFADIHKTSQPETPQRWKVWASPKSEEQLWDKAIVGLREGLRPFLSEAQKVIIVDDSTSGDRRAESTMSKACTVIKTAFPNVEIETYVFLDNMEPHWKHHNPKGTGVIRARGADVWSQESNSAKPVYSPGFISGGQRRKFEEFKQASLEKFPNDVELQDYIEKETARLKWIQDGVNEMHREMSLLAKTMAELN